MKIASGIHQKNKDKSEFSYKWKRRTFLLSKVSRTHLIKLQTDDFVLSEEQDWKLLYSFRRAFEVAGTWRYKVSLSTVADRNERERPQKGIQVLTICSSGRKKSSSQLKRRRDNKNGKSVQLFSRPFSSS